MATLIQEFDAAAREIETLLASASSQPAQSPTSVVTSEWIAQAKALLQSTGRMLASAQPEMPSLRLTPELQRLRAALKLLREIVQATQERLQSQRITLQNEREYQSRARAWVQAVSKLV
jgi:hypothetical protein